MTAAAVSIEGLGKRYRIAQQRERYGRLTEFLAGAVRAPVDRLRGRGPKGDDWFWALRDVTFDVAQGDVVGIVGRNGAGKTTMLKVLAGITEPTTGRAILRGRVSSLLEVGTGFHPELTGRENIYLSGSILGMRRREIDRRFDEIVDFAEVEKFLDTPVKRYSSGMNVRLGFAVAAHLETEILIVDEVLAVGDVAFQKKSLAKMDDVSQEGRTILFVSHNMPAVETLCTSGVLLERGGIVARGTAREVVDKYLHSASVLGATSLAERTDRQGDGRLRFQAVNPNLRTGNDSEFRLTYVAAEELRNVEVAISMWTARGEGAVQLWTAATGYLIEALPRQGTIVCALPHNAVLPGTYSINIFCTSNGVIVDYVIDAAHVEVAEGDYFGTGRLPPPGFGSVLVPHRWRVEPHAVEETHLVGPGGTP